MISNPLPIRSLTRITRVKDPLPIRSLTLVMRPSCCSSNWDLLLLDFLRYLYCSGICLFVNFRIVVVTFLQGKVLFFLKVNSWRDHVSYRESTFSLWRCIPEGIIDQSSKRPECVFAGKVLFFCEGKFLRELLIEVRNVLNAFLLGKYFSFWR